MDPSPTADATRFTEPCRTSPAANTPGMLVSSGERARSSGQASRREVGAGEDEALRRPAMPGGSQSVWGSAPMSRNRAGGLDAVSVPESHVAEHEVLEPPVAATVDDLGAERAPRCSGSPRPG